ncbi:ferric reductase-like transmembrane domain-containing protein [bacterium]|nr:ferric reductase-like transmembrane domain-containing protein [bacterium]
MSVQTIDMRRSPIGAAIIWGSVGMVLLLWALVVPLQGRVANSAVIWKSLANIGAFAGTILYSWSVILSARWRWVEKLFGGLDKVYHWHHITGGLSFLLLALHPFFLTIRLAGIRPDKLSSLWVLGSNWQLNFGIIALYAMLLILPATVFLRLRYQVFLWIHRILGLVFFSGFIHAFLASQGNLAKSQLLWWYVMVFCLLAVYAFFYHSILGRFVPGRFRYAVAQVRKHGDSTVDIILEPKGRLMNFMAGQFAFVSFVGHPISDEAHPYSMASSSQQRQLRFIVKVLGDFTASLLALKPGTTAYIEGPHGGFTFRHVRGSKQVWIAGGIGVTPFLAMAQALPSKRYSVDFYYCTPSSAEAYFMPEFQAIAKRNPNFRLHLFCQDKEGFLTADILSKQHDCQRTDFLICGPPPMMRAIHDGLRKQGVGEKHILYEDFGFR